MVKLRNINKLLVANRGEIAIRVFRACTELNIRTVAIYSEEDISSYHRYKADEAYLIGKGKSPTEAYLDIEGIIHLAKEKDVDAIHPGYGFLSENIKFAKRCEEEGIIFVGPKSSHLNIFGDKVRAREQAIQSNIPVIPGSDGPVEHVDEIKAFGEKFGYPLIIKALLGGGGRGMRIVHDSTDVEIAYDRAKSEALNAFGNDEVYVEKLIENPKHIEVQVMGDHYGNYVHLYERDCSVQRRHQKVIEVAPSVSLAKNLRNEICDDAVKLMKDVEYLNAGTVEFLVTEEGYYFIEVNPRIQVEHTISELVTGIDIVQTQIKIAEGLDMHHSKVGVPLQADIKLNGYAIQSRVTTEDPLNDFLPDTGKIMVYRSSGGFGVRLDAGNGFQGSVISPYYDSLLVKVSTWALTFEQAAQKMVRNLKEFRIRGIKTNIPFLQNVISHEQFLAGDYDTTFIDRSPELFKFPKRRDRGTKLLRYIGHTTVNGYNDDVKKTQISSVKPIVPDITDSLKSFQGTKQILDEQGPDRLIQWINQQEEVLLTDTTFRDAHQSLLATRLRTKDLLTISQPTAKLLPKLFSLEMWGGATFDVAYRFLYEDPWKRLKLIRKHVPNVLLQMLLRGSNAVGYKNYPDNINKAFIAESAKAGIDVFRIFDSLNWIESMRLAIREVRDQGKIAEASICYTGNILDDQETKYNLTYYQELAKELEHEGAHILGIKDMAGLLKPEAAYQLIATLKETVEIPIHLHTHDTSGNGIFTYARAIDAGVDIVDVAAGSMAGSTSQPSGETLYHALEGRKRQPKINVQNYEKISKYWEAVRTHYKAFESGLNAPHTEIYTHEMPGGQYSNLQQQAHAVGLGKRWEEVKDMFGRVNEMFGDIVKVTPSSKVIGDLALFMVQNNLTEKDIYERGSTIDFPQSVIDFAAGYIGQPYGGFPKKLQQIILKNRQPITVRPGELLEPVDLEKTKKQLEKKLDRKITLKDTLAYVLYEDVYLDYVSHYNEFSDVSVLDTSTFFYGMGLGEEIEVDIEEGKTLFIKLVSISEVQDDGTRVIYFELNGQPREVIVRDEQVKSKVISRPKADPENKYHVGATMPGTVLDVVCDVGAEVNQGDPLIITEAMKMETMIKSPVSGRVKTVHVAKGDSIHTEDLLIEIE